MSDPARSIVITGATRGLGRTMACHMAALGHRILACGRSEDALAALSRSLDDSHDISRVDGPVPWRRSCPPASAPSRCRPALSTPRCSTDAVPYILGLTVAENGQSLRVPGH